MQLTRKGIIPYTVNRSNSGFVMAKKITVIGGAGFVGTNLCQKLLLKQQDFEIIDLKVSSRFPDKSKIADVRDIASLRAAITGDIVVHLAAIHRDDVHDKNEYRRTNVDGAQNVASVCREKGISKIVFTSSVAVYGPSILPIDENSRIQPANEYGRTKFEAEEALRKWHSEVKKSLIIVRPTVIFGPGNRGNVYNLFQQIASGKFFMVGSGSNKKSMAYIGNVVAFLETCISSDVHYAVLNYSDSPPVTMAELVSHVRRKLKGREGVGPQLPYWLGMILGYLADFFSKCAGKKLPISSIRVKKFTTSSEICCKNILFKNFEPPFLLREGIDQTLENEFLAPDPNTEIFYTE